MENKEVKVREKIGSVVKCKHCGAEFTKQFANEQYCSDECKLEMKRSHWRQCSLAYKRRKKQQQMEQIEQNATADSTDTVDTNDTVDRSES